MPVMRTRVHLFERINLMSKIRATRFMAPVLDLRNTGVNVAGGVGDEVVNAAIVGACAARAAVNTGDSVGGALQLELYATGPVEGKGGVEGNGLLQKACKDGQLINVSIKRGSYQSKLMLSPFCLHICACLDSPFPPS
jgi:hypothetical protein